ncbi:MAG: transposase [Candidatus Micrarchaeia archaeon]
MDEIIMVKVLFLQAVYGNLSDEKLEKELIDRLTFRNFFNYLESYQMQRQYGISGNYYQRLERTKRSGKQSQSN